MRSILLFLFSTVLCMSIISCEEVEEINARKERDSGANPPGSGGGGGTNNTQDYDGTVTTLTDNLGGSCPDGTPSTVSLNSTDNTFDFLIPPPTLLPDINTAFVPEAVTYSGSDFTGTLTIDDSAGDFDGSGCGTLGGYSNVIEMVLDGQTINGDNDISNAIYTISARCNDAGETSLLCSGTFSGAAVEN
ncbi:MAG: hypothetical protein ACRBBP_05540 [Bdellovibrionales bacterium]